ncbi:T9SS type A sorting domain-containing protein [Vicingaceae bacterium]|nr:T9SS type A sorting domain-containing protein [Vicingaceae bacterium]MDB4060909.1 T9SS type A sorting domain-containing protein [Vicingaceae bacterium]MDB9963807.1 T9SS type A sorting domain-containing protein [Vicingaceae bacterium]
MRKLKISILMGLLAPMIAFGAGGEKDKMKPRQQINTAAGCAPASRIIFLEFNNVRTRVEAGGIWWQDRANGVADYEVPKGSNSFSIYAGGLWLAGTDVNGQLKAAVSKFGSGVDYYTGPLDVIGTAEINDVTCAEYDRFFELTRAEVALFNAYNQSVIKGTALEDFPDYQIPTAILEWPGNGDVTPGVDQDFRLAPYMNVAGDESYEPELGDYPFYDLVGDVDCRENRIDRSISGRRPLFGDKTYWWIFNDKGNLHTESNAPSIGMEIHGQAFAFATNDEINNMTFYNFELINRSTFTLTNTFFASFVDPDVGLSSDDYVGCDVARGLGYAFNGVEDDIGQGGQTGYGANPPSIGIDFFEGPYQDADGLNNAVGVGPGEALNGLGYFDPTAREPDLVPDNERFGMRRFVYYNIGSAPNGDPELAVHYYNYMRGIWKNGRRMRHGGNGFNTVGVEEIPTDFMFPGTSDPLHWGTTDENGFTTIPTNLNWTEDDPGGGEVQNAPGDRRFLQSAGPFTLRPGNVNDITVGVVFAQAQSGGRAASVEDMFTADDKAQALFDNCFQVLNGPDAPDVIVQELDKELIFYLSNPSVSNNAGEDYNERDPNIVTPEYLANLTTPVFLDDRYRFQGYQVFQTAGPGISVNDIEDQSKARLVFQCDIKDNVTSLTNFTFDKGLNANLPIRKVVAANEGIQRSFSLNQDLFAFGDAALINYKTYYYIAVAYGYNEFKPYLQGAAPDLNDTILPLKGAFDGQTTPYLRSRKSATGGEIAAFTAIPSPPKFEEGGTIVNSSFGDGMEITRLQGSGNGGNALTITQESIESILLNKAWDSEDSTVNEIDYVIGDGPFSVNVVDPLNIVDGTYYVQFIDSLNNQDVTDNTFWRIWREGGIDTVYSEKSIGFLNQQLLLSPNWGLSITITDGDEPGSRVEETNNGFISASIEYGNPERQWLSGIPDNDLEGPFNWILSGTGEQSPSGFFFDYRVSGTFIDPDQNYESILGGVIAPYRLARYELGLGAGAALNAPARDKADVEGSPLNKLMSIQLVITNDKSKWTRCPVIETKDDGLADPNNTSVNLHNKNQVKVTRLSVDKNGNSTDTTGLGNLTIAQLTDTIRAMGDTLEGDAGFINPFGMGWFPGYVINKETGDRLNMAFGEDTRYSFNNGDDMLWNPTSSVVEGINPQFINQIWGGKHFIYIFRETEGDERDSVLYSRFNSNMPVYDYGEKARDLLSLQGSGLNGLRTRLGWQSCSWVTLPLLQSGETLLSSDVRIDVNVSKPFVSKQTSIRTGNTASNVALENQGVPVYKFRTTGKGTLKGQTSLLKSALEEVNVVPNPYYSQSGYEFDQLDNTVKFTNLPENCSITIYNANGTLIRRYFKTSPDKYLDWDLTNQVGVPIASGVYIIHVEVPNVGERILKWFGTIRPADFNNF